MEIGVPHVPPRSDYWGRSGDARMRGKWGSPGGRRYDDGVERGFGRVPWYF